MFLMYLFALTKAAFGSEEKEIMTRAARLTNPEILEQINKIPHACENHSNSGEIVVEVSVGRNGLVKDIRLPQCPDHDYVRLLRAGLMKLSFIPAISNMGVAVPSTVKIAISGHVHL